MKKIIYDVSPARNGFEKKIIIIPANREIGRMRRKDYLKIMLIKVEQ